MLAFKKYMRSKNPEFSFAGKKRKKLEQEKKERLERKKLKAEEAEQEGREVGPDEEEGDNIDEEQRALLEELDEDRRLQAAQVEEDAKMFHEGDMSSMSGGRNRENKAHHFLRAAISEKYVPTSIKNLRRASYLVFLLLILLSIVIYVIKLNLFSKIQSNYLSVRFAEQRTKVAVDITLHTQTLVLLSDE